MTLEVFDSRKDIRNLFITPEIRNRIMQVAAGATAPGHTHDLGHETFLVLDGEAEFTIDGASAVLGPGQMCIARAGQWHEIRNTGDKPMTMYLSVTPHLEPTHTRWDRAGGNRLPYRYGDSTRTEREASPPTEAPSELIARLVDSSDKLAQAAQTNATAQRAAASDLEAALAKHDDAAVHRAVDAMWDAFHAMYTTLQTTEQAWNRVAPLASSR
jgi:quercetin dioxygenase-like cupin family protein